MAVVSTTTTAAVERDRHSLHSFQRSLNLTEIFRSTDEISFLKGNLGPIKKRRKFYILLLKILMSLILIDLEEDKENTILATPKSVSCEEKLFT